MGFLGNIRRTIKAAEKLVRAVEEIRGAGEQVAVKALVARHWPKVAHRVRQQWPKEKIIEELERRGAEAVVDDIACAGAAAIIEHIL